MTTKYRVQVLEGGRVTHASTFKDKQQAEHYYDALAIDGSTKRLQVKELKVGYVTLKEEPTLIVSTNGAVALTWQALGIAPALLDDWTDDDLAELSAQLNADLKAVR